MTTDERLAVLEAQMTEVRADMKTVLAIISAGAGMWKAMLGLAALISAGAGALYWVVRYWKGG